MMATRLLEGRYRARLGHLLVQIERLQNLFEERSVQPLPILEHADVSFMERLKKALRDTCTLWPLCRARERRRRMLVWTI